jgi:hypothetical protein
MPPCFFLPHSSPETTEDDFLAIARFVRRRVPERRVWRIHYRHIGQDMVAEVGQPPDSYYGEPGLVLAIFPPKPFLVITPQRGGARGVPIMIGEPTQIEYFSEADVPGP